jgi:hypothetical protein
MCKYKSSEVVWFLNGARLNFKAPRVFMIDNEYSLIIDEVIYSDAGVYYVALATPNQTAIAKLRMSYYEKETNAYYAIIGLYSLAIFSEEFQYEISDTDSKANQISFSCEERYLLRSYLSSSSEITFEWYTSQGRLNLKNVSNISLESRDEVYLCAIRQSYYSTTNTTTNKLWYIKLIRVKKVVEFWKSISESVQLATFLITISTIALIILCFAQFIETKMSR